MLPKNLQPLVFPIQGSDREGTWVNLGCRGLHHQALRGGVLGQVGQVPGGRMVSVDDLCLDRCPCEGLSS